MPTCICSPGFYGIRCQFDDKLKGNVTGNSKSLFTFKNDIIRIEIKALRLFSMFSYFIIEQTQCLDNQFTCTNNLCISSSQLCDGVDNCGDKSDEIGACHGTLLNFDYLPIIQK